MKLKITLTDGMLGTLAGDPEIAKEYIASKVTPLKNDEIEAIENIEENLEKFSTVFPRDDGKVFIWNYLVKGFLKEACRAMIDTDTMTKEQLKKVKLTEYMHKRTIDNLVFVSPRKIFINLSGDIKWCERPLRAMTRQGERICLARSEEVPAGSNFVCEITSLNKNVEDFILRWLDYGNLKGLGQWRNSGKGTFSYEVIA